MKKIQKFLFILFVIPFLATNTWSGSANKTFEWPCTPPWTFLKGGVNAVTGGGDLVFWAIGDTVSVISKNPFAIKSTFRVKTSTEIQDMLYDDSTQYLYIAAGYDIKKDSGGLQVWSVSNPAAPVLSAGFYKSTDNPGSVQTDEYTGKAIPDIDARALGLNNNKILFLTDFNFGLRVIDVTDPTKPKEKPLKTQTADRISGYKQPDINKSYLTTGGYGNMSFKSFKKDDVTGPKDYVFVLDYFNGIDVFDVTDPTVINDPVNKDTRSETILTRASIISDIFTTLVGGRLTAFITGMNISKTLGIDNFYRIEYQYYFNRLDAAYVNPPRTDNPVFSHTDAQTPIRNYGYDQLPDESSGICAYGDYAFVADGFSGLKIIKITEMPTTDTTIDYSKPETNTSTYNTHVKASYAVFIDETSALLYLASGESGLTKLDVSTPTAPSYVDNITSPVSSDDVFTSSFYNTSDKKTYYYTYVLDRHKGLRIFNSTTPEYTFQSSFLENTGTATDLSVSGNYAYISHTNGTIKVVDISDRDNPKFINPATPMITTSPNKLLNSGNYLYIADGSGGLHIFNVTDPSNPVDLGAKATAGNALSITIYNNRAYVTEGAGGVEVFDVSTPSSPNLLGTLPAVDARTVSIYPSGDSIYAFIADGAAGLKIYNVTNLSDPLTAPVIFNKLDNTTTPSPFTAVSISIYGKYAIISAGSDGILILNISTPTDPAIFCRYLTPSFCSETMPVYLDNTIYFTVAEGVTGFKSLYIYEDPPPPIPLNVPSESGCFIDSALTERGDGWSSIVISFFNHIRSWCPAMGRIITGEII